MKSKDNSNLFSYELSEIAHELSLWGDGLETIGKEIYYSGKKPNSIQKEYLKDARKKILEILNKMGI